MDPVTIDSGAHWLDRDPLDAARIRSLFCTRELGEPLELWRSLSSTLDRARELRDAASRAGAVVIAEEQTAGRGRRGAVWLSPPGLGLWLAALVDIHGVSPGIATLTTAVAVRRAVLAAAGVETRVKWPNDVEISGRKVCGIVFEVAGRGPAAVGIGINVHHAAADFPAGLAGTATSLDLAGGASRTRPGTPGGGAVPVERNRLAAHLIDELARTQAAWRSGRGHELLDAWRDAASHLGRRVRVIQPGGVIEGVTAGIAADGALLIDLPHGERRSVLAGSLRVLD